MHLAHSHENAGDAGHNSRRPVSQWQTPHLPQATRSGPETVEANLDLVAIDPKKRRRVEPAVAGDDVAVRVGQYGIRPAEGFDRVGDLAQLLLRVRARVVRVWFQGRDRYGFDLEITDPLSH
jgi:hypothetical protein